MSREDLIVETIRDDCPEVKAIYLFGSYSQGVERPASEYDSGSDIDIAVLLDHDRKLPTNLISHLSDKIQIGVDLIDLRKVPTILQKEVIANGKRLWAANTLEADEFELLVWSSYQKLCEERAEIVQAGISSGRFYQP